MHALRAFAAARGARLSGDGVLVPVTMIGQVRGRPYSVTWQRAPGTGDVLIVGVDCATAAERPVEVEGGAETVAGDAALVSRWTRPAPELFATEKLDALLDAMARMAEELEASEPGGEEE